MCVVLERSNANGHSRAPSPRGTFAWLGLTFVAVAAVALACSDPAALCALPALVLPALFALRRYPGERMIAVLRDTRRRLRRRPIDRVRPSRHFEVALARGGLLIARSLAVRPPPGASFAAS